MEPIQRESLCFYWVLNMPGCEQWLLTLDMAYFTRSSTTKITKICMFVLGKYVLANIWKSVSLPYTGYNYFQTLRNVTPLVYKMIKY